MSEDLSHLTDEDLEAIDAIVEGSVRRQMGQQILDAVAASEARRQGSADDPLLKALDQAYRAKAQEGTPE